MPTIQEVIDGALDVRRTQESRIIEVSQVAVAVEKAVTEEMEDQAVEIDLTAALDKVKQTAAELTNSGTDDLLDQLLQDVTVALAKKGEHVVSHQEMVDAINKAVLEQAEADAANIAEDAAIESLKQLANDYVKE